MAKKETKIGKGLSEPWRWVYSLPGKRGGLSTAATFESQLSLVNRRKYPHITQLTMIFCFSKLEYYGVYDESLQWFKKYFTERKQFVHPPGETPHMKRVGMLVGNFELNP